MTRRFSIKSEGCTEIRAVEREGEKESGRVCVEYRNGEWREKESRTGRDKEKERDKERKREREKERDKEKMKRERRRGKVYYSE